MEIDWLIIAFRLALFLFLMLLTGLAAFPLYALPSIERKDPPCLDYRQIILGLALSGLVVSLLGFLNLIAAMTNSTITRLDWVTVGSILTETALGAAWQVRMIALLAVLIVLYSPTRLGSMRLRTAFAAGAVSLVSLIWAGHAGASEGRLGLFRIANDAVHMIAAAIWIGGIFGFLIMLHAAGAGLGRDRLVVAHLALLKFSAIGTICVALIVGTGLINSQLTFGLENVPLLSNSSYGQLLIAKLILMALMLLFAAKNRWLHTPQLQISISTGSTAKAIMALRKSLLIEASLAALILALVAILGTMEPPTSPYMLTIPTVT